jgi:sugar-phosphatase
MINAAIFDLDGLLIDSEPLWEEATISTFKDLGVHVTLEMCWKFKGMRIDDAMAYVYSISPWNHKSFAETELSIMDEVERLIRLKGRAKEGCFTILNFFKEQGIPMAIASSSWMRVIQTAVEKLEIANYFVIIHSAQFEKQGKPYPDIYLTTAKKLGVIPDECLVFEDSFHGVVSGKSAGMKVVAVPDSSVWEDGRYEEADMKLRSLSEFDVEQLNKLNKIK